MIKLLGVVPGAVTLLALINDDQKVVTVVIDVSLMQVNQIKFHPLINTKSTGFLCNPLIQ